MSFKSAFTITVTESGPRLEMARELLAQRLNTGGGMVLLEGSVGVYRYGDRVVCEVITRFPSSRNSERFATELAQGQQLLASSTLGESLEKEDLDWCVVDDNGMGRVQVWPAS